MLVDAGSNLGLALLQLTRFFVVFVLRNSPSCANHVEQNSWYSARDLDREGICECHFPETVEASRGAGVTGVEVGAKNN